MKKKGRSTFSFIVRRLERLLLRGNQPDFLIVGAQKCGTTSLYNNLASTPGFIGSKTKEIHFFGREDNYRKGFDWYERHFVKWPWQVGLLFEASPENLFRPYIPQRLKNYKPDLKIIILIREPIARAYSAWNMYRQWSEDGVVPQGIAKDPHGRAESPLYRVFFKGAPPSFSEYIQLEMGIIEAHSTEDEPSILRRGLYKEQIERYVDLFGWHNILLIGFNQLKNDSPGVLRQCQEFLGIEPCPRGQYVETSALNARTYPSAMTSSDMYTLQRFYERPNAALFEYLGYVPDW